MTANGTIGVTYYDLRSNTGDATTLPEGQVVRRAVGELAHPHHVEGLGDSGLRGHWQSGGPAQQGAFVADNGSARRVRACGA